MAGPRHALTLRSKGQTSNPNPNRPALVCMFIRLHIVTVSLELGEYCQLEMFHASCAPGHVVMMTSAVYGRMRIGQCMKQDYGFIGCSADVLRFVDRLCSGRQVCEFPVAELHGNQPCPDDLTPYLEASYQCVPGKCLLAPSPTWWQLNRSSDLTSSLLKHFLFNACFSIF